MPIPTEVIWKPPPQEYVKINIDGSCTADGTIAAGGPIRNHEGAWIKGFLCNLGIWNAFEDELWRIYKGLLFGKDCGSTKIVVEYDARVIIDVINSSTPANHPSANLFLVVRGLQRTFENSTFVFVPRMKNKAADHHAALSSNMLMGFQISDSPRRPPGSLLLLFPLRSLLSSFPFSLEHLKVWLWAWPNYVIFLLSLCIASFEVCFGLLPPCIPKNNK